MKITAEQILAALKGASTSDTVFIPELRLGSGFGDVAQRRIDLLKVETAPSKGHLATAYEIKISRSDFFNDIKKPKKQRGARLFSDHFYYATPPGLVKIEEVPVWAGLVEFQPEADDQWRRFKTVIPAPRLDKERPTWGLFVSAIRNVSGVSAQTTAQNQVAALKQKVRDLELKAYWQDQEILALKLRSDNRASETEKNNG